MALAGLAEIQLTLYSSFAYKLPLQDRLRVEGILRGEGISQFFMCYICLTYEYQHRATMTATGTAYQLRIYPRMYLTVRSFLTTRHQPFYYSTPH